MRIFKPVLTVLAVLAFVACLNAAITFALFPYGSKSEVMWTDYRLEEGVDMVFTGTSISERAFDPAVVDEACGVHSYNASTPSQLLEETYLGLDVLLEDGQVHTVVYGLEYSSLIGEKFPDPARSYLIWKNKGRPADALHDTLWCLTHERCYTATDSLNWVFPWVNNHVGLSPSDVWGNIQRKTDGTSVYDAAVALEPDWVYYGQGYGNYDYIQNYNCGSAKTYEDDYHCADFDEQKMAALADVCDACVERGVDILVVMPPIPVFNVYEYGDKYFEQSDQVRALVESHGGEFYDLNMAKPELLDLDRTDIFADFQHLNHTGAEEVSKAFSVIYNARAAGEDVSRYFYTPEEYKAVSTRVDFVMLHSEKNDEGFAMQAEALAGASAQLEYQYMLKNEAGEWEVIRDWSDDPAYLFAPEEPGEYKVCVNVRTQGSDAEYDRYRTVKVNKEA
ncbi:triple tyrosine motif-containing protein [Slackia heliotrinireducens]|uniref:triple tyrosine motif-containing protein n=1 Tax=Slackia heliotrinireducens TaxID=84110 RepID=UPI00331607F4